MKGKLLFIISLYLLVFSLFLQGDPLKEDPYIVVLGIAQDAGYPQASCSKKCCIRAWQDPKNKRFVSCLALVMPKKENNEVWLFDATPDFKEQIHLLENIVTNKKPIQLKGIFLTHGHMGHYTGLMHLGREAIGAKNIDVYVMPRMMKFLKENGPWSQLVKLKNIKLLPLYNDTPVILYRGTSVVPFLVPHRDEFTETVGYKIHSGYKSLIFIPDIDKWEKWQRDITAIIKDPKVFTIFIDGTFFANGEIPGRDISKIPHPFIVESMKLFANLTAKDKAKIHFIHLNHTNPALQEGLERKTILENGFQVAKQGQIVSLPDLVEVERVISGDTIELKDGRIISYLGVQAPARDSKYFTDSKRANEFLIKRGQYRVLLYFPKGLEQNSNKHLRAFVYCPYYNLYNFANKELLLFGFVSFSRTGLPDKYIDEFSQLEQKARLQKSGIWQN